MTRDETKKIIQVICMTYPNFRPQNLSDTVDAWHFFLADHDYNRIAIALKTFVNAEGSAFPPSCSQLIGMTHKAAEMADMDATAAWHIVRRAIGRSNYYADEEFAKFPEDIRNAVGSPSQLRLWAQMESESLDSVVSSNFIRTFTARQKKKHEYERMPIEMRSQVDALMQKKAVGIEDKHEN